MCSSFIKFEVGNKSFSTTIDTLSRIPYFAALMKFPSFLDGKLQIDSDASVFKHVLRWAQNVNYSIPEKYHWGLDFWGLPIIEVDGVAIEEPFDLRPCQTTIKEIDNELLGFDYWACFNQELSSEIKQCSVIAQEVDGYILRSCMFLLPVAFKCHLKSLEFDMFVNDQKAVSGPFDETSFNIKESEAILILKFRSTMEKIINFYNSPKKVEFRIKMKEDTNNLLNKITLKGKLLYQYHKYFGVVRSITEVINTGQKVVNGHVDTFYDKVLARHVNSKNKVFIVMTLDRIDEIRIQKKRFSDVITEMKFDCTTKFLDDGLTQYEFAFCENNIVARYIFDIYPRPNECWMYLCLIE